MADERDKMELSAWLDGELDQGKAREIEASVARDPEVQAEVRAMEAAGAILRREVDAAEARVDMSDFSAKVMSSIESASPSVEGAAGPKKEAASILDRLRGGLKGVLALHRPAVAAAAGVLLLLGGGSAYLLYSQEGKVDPTGSVVVRGGATVIEDLRFGEGSAVVYRTESDVTVIWVTED